jgi:glycosyltransferase involved in cell wall biosynthesis
MGSKIKYSVILPYYDRAEQLKNTLESFDLYYSGRADFEVVIVRDSKCDFAMNRELDDIVEPFDFQIIVIDCCVDRPCFNPATAFNQGVEIARGEYIILTSPECSHKADILAGFDEEFAARPFSYVICSCWAVDRKKKRRTGEETGTWYQHSEHRNKQYHFCSCLSKSLFLSVGGFDERFTDGYGYDDDAFRDRVRMKGVFFKNSDDLMVFHQYHDKVKPANWKALLDRNRKLYEKEYLGHEIKD